MYSRIYIIVSLIVLSFLFIQPVYPFTTEDIIKLVEAKFDENLLISQIEATKTVLSLTGTDIESLREKGASENLLSYLKIHFLVEENADIKKPDTSSEKSRIRILQKTDDNGRSVVCLTNINEDGQRIGGELPQSERLRLYDLSKPKKDESEIKTVPELKHSFTEQFTRKTEKSASQNPRESEISRNESSPNMYVNVQNTIINPTPPDNEPSFILFPTGYYNTHPFRTREPVTRSKKEPYRLKTLINPSNPYHMSNYMYPFGDRLRNLYFKHTSRDSNFEHIYSE
ncbi:MAG: hypothetical protein A2161_06965 [Candidatus Schekmanbacteria bacterium RBG_13_48_7]|uniref:Uncharacterized protein n=1 Tax=Candidatus Schekmanbacteria bacterium RBG_13_48_7 TaxID=1817878 RepID=A0A1F7RUI7_9BACT|nr:MAG: hypothetical protein A2161_06965 [Candidatus Schekmanbacteria bacterium RBG_13_48_7]